MPDGGVKTKNKSKEANLVFKYMPGFGNDFETEALAGALPQGMNSPQKCAYGLYAEQLSGTPFTPPSGIFSLYLLLYKYDTVIISYIT